MNEELKNQRIKMKLVNLENEMLAGVKMGIEKALQDGIKGLAEGHS